MAGRPTRGAAWTQEQDDELRRLVAARRNVYAIAAEMRRTVDAIRGRAQLLRLPLTVSRRPWREQAGPPVGEETAGSKRDGSKDSK